MYNVEDIQGFLLNKKKDTLFVDNSTEREQELLSYIEELEKKIEKLESNKNYEDIVRKIFKKTQRDMFMGGEQMSLQSITDDILFIH